MQTFLPYADFEKSAASLDRMRLGKQRVENLQVIHALIDPAYGWQNHPAVKMWRGYIPALVAYQYAITREWTQARGYKDTCMDKSLALLPEDILTDVLADRIVYPHWLGDEEFHTSHKSNLIRKLPEYYTQQFPGVPGDIEYVWPDGLS